MSEERRKLNLKNVVDLIGEEYSEWSDGDFVIIETQTGTGKTYFIEQQLIRYLSFSKVLFLCNRINLVRQIKKDLLAMYNMEIPSSVHELDNITNIKSTTIKSYQAFQERILNDKYYKTPQQIAADMIDSGEFYDYIILDECHYIFSDSSFNNTTRLIFEELVENSDFGAVKIFMTATADEIKGPILEYVEKIKPRMERIPYLSGGMRGEFKPRVYSSGIDYSYIKAWYFKHIEDIITTIQNDKSDDKWIVFVSNKEKYGQPIKEALGEDAVFITADTDPSDIELVSIINNSTFTKKVLITTKTLDNGINIKDERVKHIVIMAWDKITFVQMLGRRRVNIENADTVNLYIPMRYKKSFAFLLKNCNDKLEKIELCKKNPNEFSRKYDNGLRDIAAFNELFYRDNETGNWTVNPIGAWRVNADKEFVERMIEKFNQDKKFAFIKEQLSWIGLENTFDEANLIENVLPNEERDELENYLAGLYEKKTVMLMREDRQELIEKINVRDGNNRILKNIKTLNSALEELGSQFVIKEFETSRNQKKYKNAWRIAKRI